jgi:hypothetical protein
MTYWAGVKLNITNDILDTLIKHNIISDNDTMHIWSNPHTALKFYRDPGQTQQTCLDWYEKNKNKNDIIFLLKKVHVRKSKNAVIIFEGHVGNIASYVVVSDTFDATTNANLKRELNMSPQLFDTKQIDPNIRIDCEVVKA